MIPRGYIILFDNFLNNKVQDADLVDLDTLIVFWKFVGMCIYAERAQERERERAYFSFGWCIVFPCEKIQ